MKLTALLLGTSLVLAACGGGGEEGKDTENQAGETTASAEDLFKQNCASCHGQNLEGASAPKLAEVGSKYSEDEIKNIILNGQGGMPAGLLDESEASVVAEWLAAKK
nr:cytochrome c [Bacillus sp. FJAT-47783]